MPSDGKNSHCLWQGELKRFHQHNRQFSTSLFLSLSYNILLQPECKSFKFHYCLHVQCMCNLIALNILSNNFGKTSQKLKKNIFTSHSEYK